MSASILFAWRTIAFVAKRFSLRERFFRDLNLVALFLKKPLRKLI